MNVGRAERSQSDQPRSYVHVRRGEDEAWLVKKSYHVHALASYRLKSHALAYARALAFSCRVDMIVHDLDDRTTRHDRASLTYPTRLD
jgi:hypothetical protein